MKQFFKNRSIDKLLAALQPALRKRYGAKKEYTQAQVATTIKEQKLNDKYADYAYMVFCSEEECKKYGFYLEEIKREKHNRSREGSGGCGGSVGEGSCGGD